MITWIQYRVTFLYSEISEGWPASAGIILESLLHKDGNDNGNGKEQDPLLLNTDVARWNVPRCPPANYRLH